MAQHQRTKRFNAEINNINDNDEANESTYPTEQSISTKLGLGDTRARACERGSNQKLVSGTRKKMTPEESDSREDSRKIWM